MIREISLNNFKCFDTLKLPMKNVNVLTGINGMGKSTVIQSLLLLRQSYQKDASMKGLYLNGTYIRLGNGQDVLYEKADQESIGIGFSEEDTDYYLRYGYLPESDYLPVIEKKGKAEATGIFGKRFSYLSAYRIEPLDLYHIINEEELKEREFGNNGEFAIQFLSMYGEEQVRNPKVVIEDKLGTSLANQTRVWMDRISPGVSPKVTVNTQLRHSEVRYEYIEGRNKTNSYKSVNVGFGITYVLPIVVALLSAEKGDLIIIENPEAHIHPGGQRKLGELIAAAGAGGVQVIVETHSDHILNGIRLAVKRGCVEPQTVNLMFFNKSAENDYRHEVIFPQMDCYGRLDQWPEGFFDEWDNALLELL
ncbi:MAG: DUF3696 domain-containing protein [Lachnospiraceae bacterium]